MNTKKPASKSNQRRENVLQAAAKLFGQMGFDGTSFSIVAEQAGEQKTFVQYHFDNKEVLWKEAVAYVWRQRNNALPRYIEDISLQRKNSDDKSEMIRDLCRRILQFTFDNPEWVKIMFQESSMPGPRLDWLVEEFLGTDFIEGRAMIELAQHRGLLPKVDSMDLLHILSGALIYLVNVAPITERILGVEPSSTEYMEHHIDTLMRILN
ncbi:TetR/AcrR family transcriptional regulator [Zhongshania aquimaris]|uniref:TetR/AcrR family transcriptional regulator n=1 Tax=Zhongshania aquimaris TaxID=2857107 RepID=A0ABS6VS36_9GAMM|nr:TetR/AcrR family transcriptional regulator [Zhongshania aquimaris]MBW2941119.1 TetR/AcrR family transcriptional regulator [Zhongshania aquimaris]